jgi:hypothetical protein
MKSLRRDLFERRLWPLAVVIVAAIVAVPFLLHGHRANASIAAPPAADGTATTPSPATTHHSDSHSKPRTTPTSHTRDPFVAASVDVKKTASAGSKSTTTATTSTTSDTPPSTSTDTGTASSGAGSSSPPATTTPVTTTPATTTPVTTAPPTTSHHVPTKIETWNVYSVDLRIGAHGHAASHHDVARLMPLPRERSPQVIYMGVDDHGHNAVFALGAGVVVRPAGGSRSEGAYCHPSRKECSLVVIPDGKTVALDYVSATGSDRALFLRVVRIRSKVTSSAAVLKAARAHVSALGLCDLKLGDPIGFVDPADDSVSVPSAASCRDKKLAVPFPGSLGAGSSVQG